MQKEQEQQNVFVKPHADRILIERDPIVKETASGISIPETAREKPSIGTIRLVGDECKVAKVDDRIFFGKGAGVDISIGNMVFTMLRENEIYAFTNLPAANVGKEYGLINNKSWHEGNKK